MPDIIDYRFRLRRGLKATWQALNDILLDGEIGLEKDTGFFKVGDGLTHWNDLQYHVSGGIKNFGTIQNGEVLVWASGKWEPGQAGGTNYLVQNDMPLADGSEKNIVTSRTWKGLPLLFEDGLLVPSGEYDASIDNNILTFGSNGTSVGAQYSIVGSYEKADTTAIWTTYEIPYNLDVRWDSVQDELKLTWDFDGDDPDKFYIFRDDDPLDPGNMPSPIGDVDGTEREFFDDDINFEDEAYYKVGYYEGPSLVLSADIFYKGYVVFDTSQNITVGVVSDSNNDPLNPVKTSTFGNLSGLDKWFGGALAPNGKIYCAPLDSSNILEIDPATKGTSTFGSISGSKQFEGAITAPNGKIYCIPRRSTSVLEIDPGTKTTSSFASLGGSLTNKWRGGVLAPNGKIYCVPSDAKNILVIDPSNNSTDTFGNVSGGWSGGVLAPNGKIYCVPNDAKNILVIDPSNNSTDTFGNVSGGWSGGVLAPNGKIYCVPHNATTVLEIDPLNNSTKTFGSLSGTYKWIGGVLAPNGKIYCVPYNPTTVLEIDPIAQTAIEKGSVSGSDGKYNGCVLGMNGNVYGIPRNNRAVLEISFYDVFSDYDPMLSPFYNKY